MLESKWENVVTVPFSKPTLVDDDGSETVIGWGQPQVRAPLAGLRGVNGTSAPADAAVEPPPAPPPPPPPPPRPVTAGKEEQDGLTAKLQWLERAVEECSRAFTRLGSRLRTVEGRLEALEEQSQKVVAAPPVPPVVSAPVAAAPPAMAPPPSLQPELDRLAARIKALEEQQGRRVDFAEPEPVAPVAAPGVAAAVAAGGVDLAKLREQVDAAQRRVAALELRTTPRSLTKVVSDIVAEQVERVAAEMVPGAGDLESVYREVESVVEQVSARESRMAIELGRVASLEREVADLRTTLGRVVAGLDAFRDLTKPDRRLVELESRLNRLEGPVSEAEPLLRALAALSKIGAGSGAGVGAGGGSGEAGPTANGRG